MQEEFHFVIAMESLLLQTEVSASIFPLRFDDPGKTFDVNIAKAVNKDNLAP